MPATFADFWLLEVEEDSAAAHWSRLSPTIRLPKRRRMLPRSSATLTHLPAPDGGPGKVYLFGGQEPVEGVCYSDLLVGCTTAAAASSPAAAVAALCKVETGNMA